MNFIDVVIIAALIYAGWKGFKKGFVIELFTFLAFFLGLYAGIHFSDYIAGLLVDESEAHQSYMPAAAFTLVFLAIGAMVYFGGKSLEKVVKIAQLNLLNKLLGVFFSVLKMIFGIGVLILLMESYDKSEQFVSSETRDGSFIYRPTKKIVTFCIPAFESSMLLLKDTLFDESTEDEITDEHGSEENS